MTEIEFLLQLYPEVYKHLRRHPRSVTLRQQFTLEQLHQLRKRFPRVDDRTPGRVKVHLPENYDVPPLHPLADDYQTWCNNITGYYPQLTHLPSRTLWKQIGGCELAHLLVQIEHLPKGELWTWSQLGSKLFNDSKSIRSGALHNWIAKIQENFGLVIEDNPYTSCVVSFHCGIDALPRARTLEEVLHEKWEQRPIMIRSYENAAPFRQAVKGALKGDLLIYTEGHPNRAVRQLLQQLPRKVSYQHYGDTDADGFMIASELFAHHPGTMVLPPPTAPTRSLSQEQIKRAQSLLANASDKTHFPYNAIVNLLHTKTWVEQEAWA